MADDSRFFADKTAVKNLIYSINWGSPAYFNISDMSLVNDDFKDSVLHDSFFFGAKSATNSTKNFLNASILSINTPNVTSQPIEEWIGGRWIYTNGRQELRQLEMTFRDTADALLWRNFIYIYDFLQNRYPDECKWNISINTASIEKTNRLDMSGNTGATIISTSDAILSSISPLNLSKENGDAFTTFSVVFKYYISKRTTENFSESSKTYAK